MVDTIPAIEQTNSKKRGFEEITPFNASVDDDEGEESEYDSEEEREEVKQAIMKCFLKRNEPLTSS
jgi:hypothetical protein